MHNTQIERKNIMDNENICMRDVINPSSDICFFPVRIPYLNQFSAILSLSVLISP